MVREIHRIAGVDRRQPQLEAVFGRLHPSKLDKRLKTPAKWELQAESANPVPQTVMVAQRLMALAE